MNATVTDAHRQKCADLANEASHLNASYEARDALPNSGYGALTAFAQYVANTEAREAEHESRNRQLLGILSGPGSDTDKLAAVRAIVEPVDPFVLEAERRLAERFLERTFDERIAAAYRNGDYRASVHVNELAAALREGAGK
jgi:hypothetical protein